MQEIIAQSLSTQDGNDELPPLTCLGIQPPKSVLVNAATGDRKISNCDASEYTFGPQVYSEVPNLLPADLLNPQEKGENRLDYVLRQMKKADVVLMDLNAFLYMNNEHGDELWEALGDRTERSVGQFMLME